MSEQSVIINAGELLSVLQKIVKGNNGNSNFDVVIRAKSEGHDDYCGFWRPTDTLEMKTKGIAGRQKTIFEQQSWWNSDAHKTEWTLTMDGKTTRNYELLE